jgi:hypothetical protein
MKNRNPFPWWPFWPEIEDREIPLWLAALIVVLLVLPIAWPWLYSLLSALQMKVRGG